MEVNRSGLHAAIPTRDTELINGIVCKYKQKNISEKESVSRKIGISFGQGFENQEYSSMKKYFVQKFKDAYRICWLSEQPDSKPVEIRHKPIYEDDDFRAYIYPPVLVDALSNQTVMDFRESGIVCVKGVKRSFDGNILRVWSHEKYHFFVNDDGDWKRYIGMDTCPDELFADLSYCNENKRISLLQSAPDASHALMTQWVMERESLETRRFGLRVCPDEATVIDTKSEDVVLNFWDYKVGVYESGPLIIAGRNIFDTEEVTGFAPSSIAVPSIDVKQDQIGCITGYVFSQDGCSLLIQAAGKISLFVRWPCHGAIWRDYHGIEKDECWRPYLRGTKNLGYSCANYSHRYDDYVPYDGVIGLDNINSGITCSYAENLLHKALASCEPFLSTMNTSDHWLYLIKLLLENGANPNKECHCIGSGFPEWYPNIPKRMTPFYLALSYAMQGLTSSTKMADYLLTLFYKHGAMLPLKCQSAQDEYKDIYDVALEAVGTLPELPETFIADVLQSQFTSGETMLAAMREKEFLLLERLLKYRYSVNTLIGNQCLLLIACKEEEPSVVEWLLKKGASCNCRCGGKYLLDAFLWFELFYYDLDDDDEEELDIGSECKKKCIELLFDYGVSPRQTDYYNDFLNVWAAYLRSNVFTPELSSMIAIRTGMLEFVSLKGLAQEAVRKATGYDPDKYHKALSFAYEDAHVIEKLKEPLIPVLLN